MLGDTISNTSKLMHLLQHLNIVVIASQKLKVSYFLEVSFRFFLEAGKSATE